MNEAFLFLQYTFKLLLLLWFLLNIYDLNRRTLSTIIVHSLYINLYFCSKKITLNCFSYIVLNLHNAHFQAEYFIQSLRNVNHLEKMLDVRTVVKVRFNLSKEGAILCEVQSRHITLTFPLNIHIFCF